MKDTTFRIRGNKNVVIRGSCCAGSVPIKINVRFDDIPDKAYAGEFDRIAGLPFALLSHWHLYPQKESVTTEQRNRSLLMMIAGHLGKGSEFAQFLYDTIQTEMTETPLDKREGATLILLMEGLINLEKLKTGTFDFTDTGRMFINHVTKKYQEHKNGTQRTIN